LYERRIKTNKPISTNNEYFIEANVLKIRRAGFFATDARLRPVTQKNIINQRFYLLLFTLLFYCLIVID